MCDGRRTTRNDIDWKCVRTHQKQRSPLRLFIQLCENDILIRFILYTLQILYTWLKIFIKWFFLNSELKFVAEKNMATFFFH